MHDTLQKHPNEIRKIHPSPKHHKILEPIQIMMEVDSISDTHASPTEAEAPNNAASLNIIQEKVLKLHPVSWSCCTHRTAHRGIVFTAAWSMQHGAWSMERDLSPLTALTFEMTLTCYFVTSLTMDCLGFLNSWRV